MRSLRSKGDIFSTSIFDPPKKEKRKEKKRKEKKRKEKKRKEKKRKEKKRKEKKRKNNNKIKPVKNALNGFENNEIKEA